MINELEYFLLSMPFKQGLIKWRIGNVKADKTEANCLAYVDARDVMFRLDKVVGMEGWSTYDKKEGDTYFCGLTINGVTKTGAAGATNVEGEKGGSSDAFKRAAVLYGVSRYLYYCDQTWLKIKPAGKSFVIVPSKDSRLTEEAHYNVGKKHKTLTNTSKNYIKGLLDMVDSVELLEALHEHEFWRDAITGWNDADKRDLENRYKQIHEALSGEANNTTE